MQAYRVEVSRQKDKGIDAYALRVMFQTWPVDLRFIPSYGVNIEAGSFKQKVSSLKLSGVSFMGERRELVEPATQIKCDAVAATSNGFNRAEQSGDGKHLGLLGLGGVMIEAYVLKNAGDDNVVAKVFEFSQSVTDVRTNGLLRVQAKAQDFSVAYTNETPSKCRVVLDATFLNPCGAQIFAVRDEKKLGAWEGGESLLSMPVSLQGCRLPRYVMLKWTRK